MALVNVALMLAIVTMVCALADWRFGVVASAASALVLNYFHTEPVHSFRVASGEDVLTIVLLGVLGIGVSTYAALRVQTRVKHVGKSIAEMRSRELFAGLRQGTDSRVAWEDAVRALSTGWGDLRIRLVQKGRETGPRVSRNPDAGMVDELIVSESGVLVEFADPRIREELLVTARSGCPSVIVSRSVVLRMVNDIERLLTAD